MCCHVTCYVLSWDLLCVVMWPAMCCLETCYVLSCDLLCVVLRPAMCCHVTSMCCHVTCFVSCSFSVLHRFPRNDACSLHIDSYLYKSSSVHWGMIYRGWDCEISFVYNALVHRNSSMGCVNLPLCMYGCGTHAVDRTHLVVSVCTMLAIISPVLCVYVQNVLINWY